MTLILITGLFGIASLAIDVGYSFSYRENMRNAADAAALVGAMAVLDNASISDADLTELVHKIARDNGFDDDEDNVIVNVVREPQNPPDGDFQFDYSGDSSAVGVEIIRNNRNTFFNIFSFFKNEPIICRAVANRGTTGIGTMFLFKPTGTAISISGNASTLDINGTIFMNSDSNTAISTGSGTLIADGAATVAANPTCNNCLNLSGDPLSIIGGIEPMLDPLRNIPVPSEPSGSCLATNKLIQNTNQTLEPGKYCSTQNKPAIEIKNATATFKPGIYYIKGGGINVQSGGGIATSTAFDYKGVMIYNTGGLSNIKPDGTYSAAKINYPYGSIDLRGATRGVELFGYDNPDSPDYKGLLLFQDRENSKPLQFGSSANTQLNGIVYIIKYDIAEPYSIVYTSGSTTAASGYTIFVISSLNIAGNGTFVMNSNYGASGSPLLPRVTLAE